MTIGLGYCGSQRCGRSGNVLARDLGDYLNEEKRVLSAPAEIADLAAAIDTLRDDTARLAARVARCEHADES